MMLRWLLLALVAAAAAEAQPLASRPDRAGLRSLRASLGLRARDWPLRSDPCAEWAGVACRAGRVVGVTVAGLRRTRLAALAPRLALDGLRSLAALETFNASGFALPGQIPAWFASALPPPLAVLDLTSAAVNGTLPAGLGASGNLTTVLLAGNALSGPVPAPLLSVGGLRVLDLSRNNFSGGLPNVSAAAGGAVADSLFNISGNSLYGVAGDAIAALTRRFQVVDVLYTGTDSENVRVWRGRRELAGFRTGSGLVKAIVVAADGRIFTGHRDGKVRVWRADAADPAVHRRSGTTWSAPSTRPATSHSRRRAAAAQSGSGTRIPCRASASTSPRGCSTPGPGTGPSRCGASRTRAASSPCPRTTTPSTR
jgi:hypothetical protein